MTDLKTAWFADHAPGRGKLITLPVVVEAVSDGLVTTWQSGSFTSLAFPALATARTNDMIIVYAVLNSLANASISSITSSPSGLTFTERVTHALSTNSNIEATVWTAPAAAVLANEIITINMSGTTERLDAIAFGFAGVKNTASPFDANVSLPKTRDDFADPTPDVSAVSTTSAYDAIFAFLHGSWASPPPTLPTGFTSITLLNESLSICCKIVLATQSSIAISYPQDSLTGWILIADALVLK